MRSCVDTTADWMSARVDTPATSSRSATAHHSQSENAFHPIHSAIETPSTHDHHPRRTMLHCCYPVFSPSHTHCRLSARGHSTSPAAVTVTLPFPAAAMGIGDVMECLKKKIHGSKIPLSLRGQRMMAVIYMVGPIVGGTMVMKWAMGKEENNRVRWNDHQRGRTGAF